MRKIMQRRHVDFSHYDIVDAGFLRLFSVVYDNVIVSGSVQAPGLPEHTHRYQRDNATHDEAMEVSDEEEQDDENITEAAAMI
jgi:hypothetical protein